MLTTDDIVRLTKLIRFIMRDELKKFATKKDFSKLQQQFNTMKNDIAGIRKELDTEHASRYERVQDHEVRIVKLEKAVFK